ncbi:hypothetical protein BST95_12650 [Halioglobus japonicus]|uniref:Uncharacterized protein n=1 Tax=Halioglobus japonicus TaxID=930805 RepID=A0AAP8SPX0_9GAMM|nr:hypothetical protein [Halioglobus japonicus]AQA18964.1 hypothetical protein BST95_12650 [Halioglobus japonicus]PLW88021.1 hypothetical protein C0029_05535 [Halioglobus japonicus]GHD20483.1 hypothetical protein GCM10007052_30170 [Halioglobus japonicus]
MTKLVELDLEFDFSDAIEAIQFDEDLSHGNSCMKRVDFIAEYEDFYLFIEVKDPDDPAAANPQAFVQKLRSDELIRSLAGKYRDSLLFRILANKCNKDMHYVVLFSMASLEPALLLSKQDALHREIPLNHDDWRIPSARSCVILNLKQYKIRFGENSVRRISDGGA